MNNNWISVEDRMPKIGQFVYGYCSSQFFKDNIIMCTDGEDQKPEFEEWRGVTHWQPLPPPPKAKPLKEVSNE